MDLGIPKSYTYADPYVERSLLHGLGLNSRRASKGSLGRGIAKGIYAVYPARTRPLGSAHWKISKLFKTPPATSVLVRGWFISTIVMHGPAIQYCNTFCIRGIYGRARTYVSLSTFRGLAIETLAGLYLNRFARRYERLLYTALCSLSRWVGGRGGGREEDTGRSCRIRILYYRALEAPGQVYRWPLSWHVFHTHFTPYTPAG